MSHPPDRLLVGLARVLTRVDAETALHVRFCSLCAIRFAVVVSPLADADECPPRGGEVFAASKPRRRRLRCDSLGDRPIHPSEESLATFALTLLDVDDEVMDHVGDCMPCLWKVMQAVAARTGRTSPTEPERRPEPVDEIGRLLADLASMPEAEREPSLLVEPRFHRLDLARSLHRAARRQLPGDPHGAEESARLALLAAGAIGAGSEAGDLLGAAWAALADARRRQEDLAGAEQALDVAGAFETTTETAGERWFFLGELRRDEGRSGEALALYDRARACFESCGAVEHEAVALMRAGVLHFIERRFAEALALFERTCGLVSHGLAPSCALRGVLGNVAVLMGLGCGSRAARVGKVTLLCLADLALPPCATAHRGWTTAFLSHEGDSHGSPWAGLRESLARGSATEAVLIGLDFAAILKQSGEDDELARLVAELVTLARSGAVPAPDRSLLAGIFEAIERGVATVEQIQHAADAVALRWTEPDLRLDRLSDRQASCAPLGRGAARRHVRTPRPPNVKGPGDSDSGEPVLVPAASRAGKRGIGRRG